MKDRYNILLIVTDQERSWETLPSGLSLPAREALRAGGVYFPNYQVNAVACSPSRSNIFTGQHIQTTGVFDNAGYVCQLDPAGSPTLGRLLKASGYFTAYAGKWHLSDLAEGDDDYRSALQPFGFDLFKPSSSDGDGFGGPHGGNQADGGLATWVSNWIAGAGKDLQESRPWFLTVNFINPHDVMFFEASERQGRTQLFDWARLVQEPGKAPYSENLGFDLPPNFGNRAQGGPSVHAAFAQEMDYDFGEIGADDGEAWKRNQNYYFNCLRDVDNAIGTVLDAVAASDGAARTIVIFTSDHGEMAGAHGLRGKGPLLYRENFAVPLVIRHPDTRGGSSSPALACAVDLVPTILELAGGETTRSEEENALVGYSLAPALENPSAAGQRTGDIGVLLNCSVVHACNPDRSRETWLESKAAARKGRAKPVHVWPRDYIDPGRRSFLRGIFDGHFRFGRYFRPSDHHVACDWQTLTTRNDLELYDTLVDPWETKNLAADLETHRATILALNAKLNASLAREVGDDDARYLPPDSVG